jgi:hypothetical protein
MDEDRLLLRLERHLAARRHDAHAHLAEGGEVFLQAALERQAAFLVEHESTHDGHGLGHRGQLEDGIGAHRDAAVLVLEAVRLVVHQLAVTRDCDHRAGYAVRLDLAGEEAVDARQPFGGEPHLVRRRRRQRLGECCGAGERSGDSGKAHGFSSCGLRGS